MITKMKVLNAIAFALYLYVIHNAPIYLMLVVIICTLLLNIIHLKFIQKKEKRNNEENKNLRHFSYFLVMGSVITIIVVGVITRGLREILPVSLTVNADTYLSIGFISVQFLLISWTLYFLLIDWRFTKAVRNIAKMSKILLILSGILTFLPFLVFSYISNNTLVILVYQYSFMIVWWLAIMYPFLNYSNAHMKE